MTTPFAQQRQHVPLQRHDRGSLPLHQQGPQLRRLVRVPLRSPDAQLRLRRRDPLRELKRDRISPLRGRKPDRHRNPQPIRLLDRKGDRTSPPPGPKRDRRLRQDQRLLPNQRQVARLSPQPARLLLQGPKRNQLNPRPDLRPDRSQSRRQNQHQSLVSSSKRRTTSGRTRNFESHTRRESLIQLSRLYVLIKCLLPRFFPEQFWSANQAKTASARPPGSRACCSRCIDLR